jgi:thymidine phosphorylase
MQFPYPWLNLKGRGPENVGLISSGAVDEKIPLILHLLLISFDITLDFHHNCGFFSSGLPISLSLEKTKRFLLKTESRSIVFDIRVPDWSDFKNLSQSRQLSRNLQDICSRRGIGSSVFLSSGSQQPGNLLGPWFEILEARDVFEGKGPPDLVKFAFEIAADFLLLTKKARHRMEANILLKEKIMSGEAAGLAFENLRIPSPSPGVRTKIRIDSLREGYLHHWVPHALLALRHKLLSTIPGSGFSLLRKQGDKIKRGEKILEAYFLDDQKKWGAVEDLRKTFVISTDRPVFRPFILERPQLRLL